MDNRNYYPSDYDLYLFHEGNNFESYRMLGAHLIEVAGVQGVRFSVWAPHAREVMVIGNFNRWQGSGHKLTRINQEGIWSIFIPGLKEMELYKFEIHTYQEGVLIKADPYAFSSEFRPGTASRIYSLAKYSWQDHEWQSKKGQRTVYNRPMLIYEVHLGSWRRKENGEFYTYRELAHVLVDYVVALGYTHIELLPVAEFPLDRSWGYQATGYYAVTSRHGTPQDFMFFVDSCHQKGIGVLLDWVPGHFCKDAHGLRRFDGMPLFEYEDDQKAERPEWGTLSFDFGKPEVQSFLISNAIFWMDLYHIDGLRVDAVASMLYLDYARKGGDWTPNQYGGHENLEAIAFLKKLNETVFKYFPEALMMAEESTAWPMVSAPTYLGGLGFNYKWNMGWMNDMLRYMELDPVYRRYHHNLLTFSFFYAFSENFILALSHDEVVHGKGSLLNKMPGDYWQKFANLRVLYGYMMTHPGKKLLFMGGEIAQFREWQDEAQLDWNLLGFEQHRKIQFYLGELNSFYKEASELWEFDHQQEGFQWINPGDNERTIVVFMRKGRNPGSFLVILCNFSPVVYEHYLIGVPESGPYVEVFNSDLEQYGGSGQFNGGFLQTSPLPWLQWPFSLTVKVPPLALIILKPIREEMEAKDEEGMCGHVVGRG